MYSSNQPPNKSILALIQGLCSIFSASIESSNPEGQSPLARVLVPGRCWHLTRLFSGVARAFPGGRVAHQEGQNEEENK